MTLPALIPPPAADLASLAVLGFRSRHTRRVYAARIRAFLGSGLPLSREGVQAWVGGVAGGAASVNQAVKAIRALVREAEARGLVEAGPLLEGLRYQPERGSRAGNWLSLEQAGRLLQLPADSARGRRDKAILALLLGCGLRREELALLEAGQWQRRDGRAWIIDVRGKGGRVRSVEAPEWVAGIVDEYLARRQEQ